MKKTIVNMIRQCLFVLTIIAGTWHIAPGQTWTTLGSPGFAPGPATSISVAIDASGDPYVAYVDHSVSPSTTTVMTYTGAAGWTQVGGPVSPRGTTDGVNIALDACGTPYVVYEDGAYGGAVTVMTFDGSTWVPVGSPGFSAGGALYTSIAIDPDGTPYVAYQDLSSESGGVSVMKFDGTNWVNVGNPGFSAGAAQYVTMAIDNGGTPFVAFKDMADAASSITVMEYADSTATWNTVGMPGFSFGEVNWPYLTLDGSGTPYVVFEDGANGNRATVMNFDGMNWKIIGAPGFSADIAQQTTMAIGSGVPYVAYLDASTGYGVTAMQFTDAGWVPFLGPVSSGGGGSPRITIHAMDIGVIYADATTATLWSPTYVHFEVTYSSLCCSGTICGIVYFYDAAGNRTYRSDTCIYWSGDPTSRHSGTTDSVVNTHHAVSSHGNDAIVANIYPNPTKNTATITTSQPVTDATVTLMDIKGTVITQKKMNGTFSQVDLSEYASGTYMITVRSAAVNFVFKVEKL